MSEKEALHLLLRNLIDGLENLQRQVDDTDSWLATHLNTSNRSHWGVAAHNYLSMARNQLDLLEELQRTNQDYVGRLQKEVE